LTVITDGALEVNRQIVQYDSLPFCLVVKGIEWEYKFTFAIEARAPDVAAMSTRESKKWSKNPTMVMEPELMWKKLTVRIVDP
jgi:hypothetical protein